MFPPATRTRFYSVCHHISKRMGLFLQSYIEVVKLRFRLLSCLLRLIIFLLCNSSLNFSLYFRKGSRLEKVQGYERREICSNSKWDYTTDIFPHLIATINRHSSISGEFLEQLLKRSEKMYE